MAYSEPFDETSPADSDLASGGDDAIRQLKRSLSERLSTFFSNWPAGDPLLGPAGADIISYGLLADKPNPATTPFFYATDDKSLWMKAGIAYLEAEHPEAGGGGSVTLPNNATIKRAIYDDSLAALSKVSLYGNVTRVLSIKFTGTTAFGTAFLTLDLDEFNDEEGVPGLYNVLNLCHVDATVFQDTTGPHYPAGIGSVPMYQIDSAANTITFQPRDWDEGDPIAAGTVMTLSILLYFF